MPKHPGFPICCVSIRCRISRGFRAMDALVLSALAADAVDVGCIGAWQTD